jgi:TatD DNase family protein
MILSDSHCHLDFNVFEGDRSLVVERAQEAGVTHLMNPAIDLDSSLIVTKLAEAYEMVYAAVGVHPNSATTWRESTTDALEQLARHPKVAAIGEIGLDYYRNHASHEQQREVFYQLLQLATKANLPVIIHSRDASPQDCRATEDVLEILRGWRQDLDHEHHPLAQQPGVMHSYSGGLKFGNQAMELGFYIGITGPVTFRNAPELQQMVSELPLDRILIETDAPFLTPHPYRGKRNEPAYVRLVADKIAEIQQVSTEVVADTTSKNAKRLFNW